MCSHRIKYILFYFIISFSLPATGSEEKDKALVTNNLGLREVLYFLYQQQYPTALAHLGSIKQENKTGQPDREAEIISAELYLSYGLIDKADTIFQGILDNPGTPLVSDEIWLELAKVHYARGSITKAADVLSRIHGPLTETQQEEYGLLNTNLQIDQGQFQKLGSGQKSPSNTTETWRYYSQYNQGVGLIRKNRVAEGINILDELGMISPDHAHLSDEIKSVKDKANITLGFYYLDEHNAAQASGFFERIRPGGPYANKALLGLGWAHADNGDLQHALTPWLTLQKGEIADSAVRESMLTVPYALNKIKSRQQALDQYKNAVDIFKKEIQLLQTSIDAIQKDGWKGSVRDTNPNDRSIGLQDIQDSIPEIPYLESLATDSEFLRTVNHYNDLIVLQGTLTEAGRNIAAYQSHLANKQHLIEEKTPQALGANHALSIDAARNLEQLRLELAHIEKTEDALALMTEKEQSQLRVLKPINDNIAVLSRLFNLGRLDDKLRIYRGIILWDITMEYDVRLINARQSLATLENDTAGLAQQRSHIKNITQDTSNDFKVLNQRLAQLEIQARDALVEIKIDINTQDAKIAGSIIAVLEGHKKDLTHDLGQAYTAIAQLYEVAYALGQGDGGR